MNAETILLALSILGTVYLAYHFLCFAGLVFRAPEWEVRWGTVLILFVPYSVVLALTVEAWTR